MFVESRTEKEMLVIIIQPRQVRQFAQAQGLLAKTDKVDARRIDQSDNVMQPKIRPLTSKEVGLISDLLARMH